MATITQYWWIIFITCFTVMLLATLWMTNLAKHFFVEKDGKRSFNIFDLEFPATEMQLDKLMYYSTPDARKQLRKHLLVDFIFMPAAYIAIALLCYKAAIKMEFVGKYTFLALAVLQILPWLFDILENGYLLNKLSSAKKPGSKDSSASFKTFQFLVKAKFAIALTASVCAVFGLFYFWIMGAFQKESLIYLAVLVIEIAVFLWLNARKDKQVALA